MTPEQTAMVLAALGRSMDGWIEELEAIEACCPICPGRTGHLLGVMRQARVSLAHLISIGEETS